MGFSLTKTKQLSGVPPFMATPLWKNCGNVSKWGQIEGKLRRKDVESLRFFRWENDGHMVRCPHASLQERKSENQGV